MKFRFPKLMAFAAASVLLLGAATPPPVSCDELWRKVGGSVRKSVTSNTQHFWAWAKENGDEHLGPYLNHSGQVMGDPHLRNVFDYRAGAKAELAVADLDDGGKGPLILDIARYITFLKAAKSELKIAEVFDAYARGLRGEKLATPLLLKNAQKFSAEDIAAQHTRYLEKNTINGKFNYKRLELVPQKEFTAAQKVESKEFAEKVKQMTGHSKVWDVGFTATDSGSSAGLSRYWVLVGDEAGPKSIVEGKELTTPALNFYEKQASQKLRVDALTKTYSEAGLDGDLFGVANAGGKDFWVRPRKFQALALDDDGITLQQEEEFSLYLANWMGQKQRAQAAGPALSKAIDADQLKAKDAVRSYVRAYLKEID